MDYIYVVKGTTLDCDGRINCNIYAYDTEEKAQKEFKERVRLLKEGIIQDYQEMMNIHLDISILNSRGIVSNGYFIFENYENEDLVYFEDTSGEYGNIIMYEVDRVELK